MEGGVAQEATNDDFRHDHLDFTLVQGRLKGVVSNGGVSRSGLALPFLSFFVLFGTFPIFLGFPRFARGFSRFVSFLFLGLLRAPTWNSPERVRDTIWTFPEKKWETPRFGKTPV